MRASSEVFFSAPTLVSTSNKDVAGAPTMPLSPGRPIPISGAEFREQFRVPHLNMAAAAAGPAPPPPGGAPPALLSPTRRSGAPPPPQQWYPGAGIPPPPPVQSPAGVGGAGLPPPPQMAANFGLPPPPPVAAAAPVEIATYSSDARYAKFLKMAKLGAAHGQLRPQMLAEGLNPAALDNPNGPIEDLPPSTATNDLISPRMRRPHSDTRELQRPVIEEQPIAVNPADLLSGLKKSSSRTSVTAGVTTSGGAPVPPVDLKLALTKTGTDLSALDKKATIKPSEAVNSPAVQLRKTGKEITLARGGKAGSPRGRGAGAGGGGGPMSPALRGRSSSGAGSPRRGGATTSPRSNDGGDEQAGDEDDEHNTAYDSESARQLNVSGGGGGSGMSTSLELPNLPPQDTSDAVYMALPPELDELSRERELSPRDNDERAESPPLPTAFVTLKRDTLPPGWNQAISVEGATYFWHADGRSVWERPTAP